MNYQLIVEQQRNYHYISTNIRTKISRCTYQLKYYSLINNSLINKTYENKPLMLNRITKDRRLLICNHCRYSRITIKSIAKYDTIYIPKKSIY